MNTHPSVQDLEALLRGTLDEDRTIVVSAHTDDCAICARELAWLRAEHELFAQRARGVPPSQVWEQIEKQIAARVSQKESRGWRRFLDHAFQGQRAQWFAVGAAAIAIFGVVAASPLSPLHKGQWFSSGTPKPVSALHLPASSDASASDDADTNEGDDESHEEEITSSTKVSGPISIEISTTSAEVEIVAGLATEAKLSVTESSIKAARFAAPTAAQNTWQLEFDGQTTLLDGHLRLQLPEGSKVQVKTASGDIRLHDVKGDATLTSASGDIDIKHGKSLLIDATSGDVHLEEITGSVAVKTISGELNVVGEINNPLRFNSVSGDLTLHGGCKVAACKVTAETTSGNILLHSHPTQSFVARLSSQSGELSGTDGLPVEMKRRPGHKTEWSAKVGSGTGSIELQTMSGDLILNHN